jgi:hypothetical protein
METVATWLTEQSGPPTHIVGDVRAWNIPGPDGLPKITIKMAGPNGKGGIRARDFTTDESVPFRNLEALKALIVATKTGPAAVA